MFLSFIAVSLASFVVVVSVPSYLSIPYFLKSFLHSCLLVFSFSHSFVLVFHSSSLLFSNVSLATYRWFSYLLFSLQSTVSIFLIYCLSILHISQAFSPSTLSLPSLLRLCLPFFSLFCSGISLVHYCTSFFFVFYLMSLSILGFFRFHISCRTQLSFPS